MRRPNLYAKPDPSKEGILYFLFCEGNVTEVRYFDVLRKLTSQVKIQIVPHKNGQNSPVGLYNNANECLITANTEYEGYNAEIDEVWFIIDTDKWGNKLNLLRQAVKNQKNWFVGQSNPCFELWQYYHFYDQKPSCQVGKFKSFLATVISGGFDSRKHIKHIEVAIKNATQNHVMASNGQPGQYSTEVFLLVEKVLPIIKEKLDEL